MNWSHFQTDIFSAVESTSDSLLIEAVAGSGKTSTLVEAVKYVPADQSVLFCAFNKAIADTLKGRIARPNTTCATLHSLGLRSWQSFCGGGVQVEQGKLRKIVSWETQRRWPGLVKLVGLAKQHGIVPHNTQMLTGSFMSPSQTGNDAQPVLVPSGSSEGNPARSVGGLVSLSDLPETTEGCVAKGLIPDTDEQWGLLCDTYGIDTEEVNYEVAREVLTKSIRMAPEQVDYDDMLAMPVLCNAPFQQFDVVFVDEVQDLNSIQIEMVSRMLSPTGRVICVGDPAQSVYRFRGAHAEAMAELGRRFNCKPLPLSISYRCPKSVVQKAQQWVPVIEHAPDAAEGLVSEPKTWELAQFRPEDVILCRLTRPLVEVAFRLIRARIACRVLGRDIGQGLLKLIDKSRLGDDQPAGKLSGWLNDYEKREAEKLKAKHEWAKIGLLTDKCQTLRIFAVPDLTDLRRSVRDVRQSIESLFRDNGAGVLTCSTIHRFKGMESKRVFVLDADTTLPPPWATDLASEANLAYVACTRAMSELYYLDSRRLK